MTADRATATNSERSGSAASSATTRAAAAASTTSGSSRRSRATTSFEASSAPSATAARRPAASHSAARGAEGSGRERARATAAAMSSSSTIRATAMRAAASTSTVEKTSSVESASSSAATTAATTSRCGRVLAVSFASTARAHARAAKKPPLFYRWPTPSFPRRRSPTLEFFRSSFPVARCRDFSNSRRLQTMKKLVALVSIVWRHCVAIILEGRRSLASAILQLSKH